MDNKRQMLVQDDSCHWYIIFAKDQQEFEQWVASCVDDTEEGVYDGPGFDDCRISGGPESITFLSPEDKE